MLPHALIHGVQGLVQQQCPWMATDSDLESLHGDPEFEAIVAPLLQNDDE